MLYDIYFNRVTLLPDDNQTLFCFSFIMFVLVLGVHKLNKLCAIDLLVVEAVKQIVIDQFYFESFQLDSTLR